MKKIQVGIVDDHQKYRNEIVDLLNSQSDIVVNVVADNELQLLLQLEKVTPEIILIDLAMLKAADILVELWSKQYPDLKIIALSEFDYEKNIIEMYKAGVKSFLRKDDSPNDMLRVIRIVYGGGAYLTDFAMQIIRNQLTKETLNVNMLGIELSEAEGQVLKYVCDGLSSTDIGDRINKSHRTVEKYREELYRKLNVTSKKELIEVGLNIIYDRSKK